MTTHRFFYPEDNLCVECVEVPSPQAASREVVVKTDDPHYGVAAEYDWIRKEYPNAKIISQALIAGKPNQSGAGKSYDRLTIQCEDGKQLKIYFDITQFRDHYW